MKRNTLGAIALALLVFGAIFALGQSSPTGAASLSGSAIKIGLVLGAFWLAWPQIDRFLGRIPTWLSITSVAGLVLIVLRPWSAVVIAPLLVALWVLSFKWLGKKK